MQISVVIPTCNRKTRLLSLLAQIDRSTVIPEEVIIVDSGEDILSPGDYSPFINLVVRYIQSEKSVCIQRNAGIRSALAPWIFLCDDDIEIPADYLESLTDYTRRHTEVGAVCGLWMEKQGEVWKATHPVTSERQLIWKYIFKLSIWGEVNCRPNGITNKLIKYYKQKGNHLSKAGWPVNTDFEGECVCCPVYSLGASLVKKEWLLKSPFDEVLDPHGIGDNYGVVLGFPVPGVHVVTGTSVYHQLEPVNRLKKSLQYYRRVLALDYFIRIRKTPGVTRGWLAWSLFGNLLSFIPSGNSRMIKAGVKSLWKIIFGINPYYKASREGKRTVTPTF